MFSRLKKSDGYKTAFLILTLALPTMIEQVMQTAVQYIDTAMVGSLGTHATAAVGATTTVGWLLGSSVSALSIGFLSEIAKACGAKDFDRAKRVSAQAVLAALVTGIFLTAVTLSLSPVIPSLMRVDKAIRSTASAYFFILYLPMLPRTMMTVFGTVLRAAGDTKTPMRVGIIINIINVVLNFLLIYDTRTVELFGTSVIIPGAGLGVLGAACASAVSFLWGGLHLTYSLLKHKSVSPVGYRIKPDKVILAPCLKVAFPNLLQRFTTSFGYVVFASMINSVGEVATAAHTIANTVESAFYIPGYGMQTAAATLAGNALGARDAKKMQSLRRMFIPIETVLMIISGAVLFVSAPSLMGIFSSSEEVITLGSTVLRMVAVSEPLYGFSIIVEGMMLGVGRTKTPFFYNVIGMWGVRIVFTFICINLLGLGLVSAWACMIGHNVLLFFLYLISFTRDSWNPLRVI